MLAPMLGILALGCVQPEPADPVEDPCDALLGGPAGADVALDLSAAHSVTRLFEPGADWVAHDEALAEVLDGDADPFVDATVAAYASAVPSTCAAAARAPLGAGSVDLRRGVATVVPGTSLPDLPDGTDVVVVDLRDIPAGPGTWNAVAAAAGLALGSDVAIGTRTVRRFSGFPFSWSEASVYTSRNVDEEVVVPGTGGAEIPLVFFTSERTAPEAAAVAAGLRLAGRAWIVGNDVHAAVAESTWTGVGERGLATRSATWFRAEDVPWPDVISADVRTSTPERVDLDDLGLDVPPVDGDATRTLPAFWVRNAADPAAGSSKGEMRAALVALHGTLKRFYPYFDLVGDTTDDALVAGLAEVDTNSGDRAAFVHTLGRFLHEIHDGHAAFADYAADAPPPTGWLVLQIQQVQGEPVVRASAEVGVEPGDTIVSVDGVPAAEWYAERMSRYSAATQGFLFDQATGELLEVRGTRTLGLRDPDGGTSTVTLAGTPTFEGTHAVPWGGTFRPSGPLDDLGGAGLYFLNLNGRVTTTDAAAIAGIAAAQDSAGLVVDMRDYPSFPHYALVPYLHDGDFVSPTFGTPTWTGPGAFEIVEEVYDLTAQAPGYTGPVALLVSNKTVSAAENFGAMFAWRDNVTVVGQQSAGTNGNTTGIELPGRFYAMFTGMRVLAPPDGRVHHGVGLVPDVEVVPTPAQFRDGVDPELMAAIDALTP